jgi:tRNA threonylcarbamoyl adenosine modification protein YjeE
MIEPAGSHITTCSEQTEALGEALAAALQPGDVVLLEGELAAGKTTLVRGLVRGLDGDPDEVSSPTFVLIQTYACHHPTIFDVHHVDLYRIEDQRGTLREIGLEELLSEPDVVVAIEWPRASVEAWLPDGCTSWRVHLSHDAENARRIIITKRLRGK